MSEQQPEGTTPAVVEQPQEGEQAPAKTYDEEYVKALRSEAAKYRTEAKAAKAEADKSRQASMTEAEKAISEARAEARSEAVKEFGSRLVRTEFDALAGRRNPDYDTASALEYIDLTRFIGDDGEPDTEAIKAAVERLIPAAAGSQEPALTPSLDLGTRSGAPMPLNGDPLEKALRSSLGIT